MKSTKIFYDHRDLHHVYKPVLTNGCFDVLHVGHLLLLELAKFNYPDSRLVVAVNDDESVRSLKGPNRPVNRIDNRMALLAAFACVDYVVRFSGRNAAPIISHLEPSVWIKGAPYTRETLDQEEVAAADSVGCKIVILEKFGDYSTTGIIERMKG